MAGSQLRFLNDEGNRRPRRQLVSHEIRPVPDDHRGGRRTQRVTRTKDVLDHRKAADLVEDFGHRRFHAGAFASGEDDDVDFGHENARQVYRGPDRVIRMPDQITG